MQIQVQTILRQKPTCKGQPVHSPNFRQCDLSLAPRWKRKLPAQPVYLDRSSPSPGIVRPEAREHRLGAARLVSVWGPTGPWHPHSWLSSQIRSPDGSLH